MTKYLCRYCLNLCQRNRSKRQPKDAYKMLVLWGQVSGWHIHTATYKTGEGNGKPLQYSCLENPMDGGAWWATVHGVATSRSRLSDFTFTFHFHALKKEMATHSSVLAWRIPGTGEPGGLLSMGSHRVRRDWIDLAAAAAHIKQIRDKDLLYCTRNSTQYSVMIYKAKES